ncbi:MAG: flagellar hook-associated protein FlgK [Rhodocyclaceae bacterium]
MGSSILNIGASGLAAAQAGLLVTGHNIANAATPGYSRQGLEQTTNTPQFLGGSYFGQGTNVSAVKRIYSQFLAAEAASAQTRVAELETHATELAQINDVLADPNAGLSPALQELFGAVQDLAADPASIPARQSVLAAGGALVDRFHGLNERFDELRAGVNSQIASAVDSINANAREIAALNDRIVRAQAVSGGRPANDLLDQRDALLMELNRSIRVTTTAEGDGSLNVFVGNGQPLVVGVQASQLRAVQDDLDPGRLDVAFALPTGGSVTLQETLLSGGALGGLLAFRSQSLDAAQNALGRIALGLAQTFNAQHRLGQDLNGTLGGDFFAMPGPQVHTGSSNGGSASLYAAITDATQLSASDYRVTATGGGSFSVLRLADGVTVSSGPLPASFDGLTVSLAAGTANAGDSFLVQPARSGARDIALAISDVRLIAAAGPLRTQAALTNAGSGAISAGEVTTTAGLAATAPHIAPPLTLTFDAAAKQFVLSGAATGTLAYDPASESSGKSFSLAAFGGFGFEISGVPANGDVFTISSNDNGTGDNRNLLALGALQSARTLLAGNASYQSAYSQLVSEAGNKGRELDATASAQRSLEKSAQDAFASVSGVNLDEEAANLMRYQQAYQAAGKLIEVSGKLFEELLAIAR